MELALRAGAAKVDISPPLGTIINGDFITHYAKYVHDSLYAKAVVLQNEHIQIAIVVVDICVMTKDFLDEIKTEISIKTSIELNNILISSTHTHFAGSVAPLLLVAADLPYRQLLPGLILKAVQQAQENCMPAKIAFGVIDVPEHVVCRRYFMKEAYAAYNPVSGGFDKVKTNPFGDESMIVKRVSQVDTGLNYLAIRALDNQWISVLANYSMHYVGDCKPGTITADYFGVFARHIASKLNAGDDFVGIMSNGTSGEASIWDFIDRDRYPKGDFEKSGLIGKDLAEKVFQSVKDVTWEQNPLLSVHYEEVKVGIRKPSSDELKAAIKTVSETDFENCKIYDDLGVMKEDLQKLYAREQVLLNEYPDTILFPVQTIKIGTGIIGGLGGEFFAETGLWLKEKAGNKYFTICMANGYIGYVPPKHEIELGGYETWRCRSSFLELKAENSIRDKLWEMIQRF
ncbi:MAG: hypothetical protein ABIN89_13245 [Chitinophagaceae bacterium]